MYEVSVSARKVEPFAALLGEERVHALEQLAVEIGGMLGARAVWNINSTAVGGGVAEMLRSLLRYARGLGVQVRWLVVEGSPEFFRITKRLHNALHDMPGDGAPLGPEQEAIYDRVTQENMVALRTLVRPGDIVICHDPQTAGLVHALVKEGTPVVWRCHIGHEDHGEEVDRAWAFLRKYLEDAPYAIFSRAAYAPGWLPQKRTVVLPPNIDPFSAKNQWLDENTQLGILRDSGLVDVPAYEGSPVFTRDDGSVGRVDRKAEVVRVGGPPTYDTPLVVQVSRWDHMKDPVGVMQGFARMVERGASGGSALVLAGPNVRAVADDPEGPLVLREVEQAWQALPELVRATIHLAQIPMQDTEENAAIVNALQRHAAVIVQKSLREGFGLTVTEAMWKRRPVVASAVGGIQDQIRDGVDGLLLRDATDLDELGFVLERVLGDPELARRLGEAGYARVRQKYHSLAALEQWAQVLRLLLARIEVRRAS